MLKQIRFQDYDFKLVVMLAAITAIGIIAIGSADPSYQMRQLAGAVLGFIGMVLISLTDYTLLLKLYWVYYGFNVLFLALVRFFGDSSHNAQRWFQIAGIRFQPSEASKILLILFYAQFIMLHKEKLSSIKNIFLMLVLFLPILGLIYLQPDFSTSIIVVIIFITMLFAGGLSLRIFLTALAFLVPLFLILLSIIIQPDQTLIRDYQRTRILAFIHPEEYETGEAYQQNNSVMAIGSGQLLGKGYRNNEITSVKNGNFISEPQTDFIFAIIGEDFGFAGTSCVILLLFLISVECFAIGLRSKDVAGTVICAGIGIEVAFQSFVNIGVATFLIPNTGLPLPFVSYGLTSLVSLFLGMGFVLNVSLQRKEKTRE